MTAPKRVATSWLPGGFSSDETALAVAWGIKPQHVDRLDGCMAEEVRCEVEHGVLLALRPYAAAHPEEAQMSWAVT
jgi:hypothetical protein